MKISALQETDGEYFYFHEIHVLFLNTACTGEALENHF
jgi:hypothetical protein